MKAVRPLLLLAAAFAFTGTVPAGVFPSSGSPQTYTQADGSTSIGDGSSVFGTVNGFFSSTIVTIQSNALRLCTATPPAGTTATATRLALPVLDAGKIVTAFTAAFDLALSAPSADPATIGEGFSLNFGPIPANAGNGETGYAMPNGLTVGWDLKDNGGEERAVEVFANGVRIGHFPAADIPAAFIIDNTTAGPATFRSVAINWDTQGLDLTWNGVAVCQNLATPGFNPASGHQFAFSGRTTGTGLANVDIDNLLVNTTASDPLFTNGPVIWEIMARNRDNIEDDDFDHPDWIEIYNGQPTAQSLAGWFLTNDPGNLQKWPFPAITLPANGYTYVFASGKNRTNAAHAHTNFTLPGEGGWLALVRPDGTIKSTVAYPEQYDDISCGFRTAFDALGYLSYPTPGLTNERIPATTTNTTIAPSVITEEPVFRDGSGTALASGFITASTSVTFAPPVTPGAEIRYTLGGAIPTATSTLYSAPISVTNRSQVIRARVFKTGAIPGPVKALALVFRGTDLTNYRGTGRPFESNLPVLMLDSFGASVDASTDPNSARPYRYTWGMLFDPTRGTTAGRASLGDTPSVSNAAGTHVRGQSSSGFPQRPYALEWWNSDDNDKDVAMLDLPADSDWVLYSPYNEETLMRNAVVYTTMLQWAGQGAGMRSRLVEVFFNQGTDGVTYADYRGIYLLVEKIKRSTSRVDIEKLNAEVTDPALNTGGYLWKKDKPPQVYTVSTTSSGPWGGQTYEVVEPNIPSSTQRSWLQTHVQSFETALYAANWQDPVNGWRRLADPASFADNLLWVEAFKQIDGYRISTYFHKTRNGKITARPAWDYNLSGGNANYLGGENISGWYYAHLSGGNLPYWPRLLQDPGYVREQWDRYWKARRSILTPSALNGLIDSFSAQIRNNDPREVRNNSRPASPPVGSADFDTPASRQFAKNPVLGVYNWPNANNFAVRNSFQAEVEFFREWLRQRLNWMDYMSMDGSAGLTRMRPPTFHDHATRAETYEANVPVGWSLAMADQDGLAGTQIFYTVNGPDPRTSSGSPDAAAQTFTGTTTTVTNLIPSGQSWRFFPSLSAYPPVQSATAWTAPAYDDTTWTSGTAPVGYGDTGMATTIATAVPTSGANQVTCFRRTFTVADPAAVRELFVELLADDGAVVWINGQEATRCNMPYAPAAITFTSRSNGAIDGVGDGEAENVFVPYRLDPALLVAGTNTIAVEVHQFQYGSPSPVSAVSNDMRFDLRLRAGTVAWSSTPLAFAMPGVHTVRARVRSGTSWSPLSEGTFTVGADPAGPSNLVISEIHYNPAPPTAAESAATGAVRANNFEFIEFLNISQAPVDLSVLLVNDAIQMDFATLPDDKRLLQPGARAVLVENRAAFLQRYPGREAAILAEWTGGNLRNEGETFTLTGLGGTTVRRFTWQNVAPWPPLAGEPRDTPGGPDFSLVLDNPLANPDHALPGSWRSSGTARGNPGNADSVPPPPDGVTDSDADGFSDFAEWAMGENQRPVSGAETLTPPGGTADRYLVLRIPRNGAADGLVIAGQSSPDAAAWGTEGLVDMGWTSDGTREWRLFRSAQPVGALPRLFLRARFTR